ncbi:MAG: FAD-binding oxidoreductase [Rhodobacteraceae bacterium]|nr:FAD-binding oxidoreductase [Paracoccaceae bacterium]
MRLELTPRRFSDAHPDSYYAASAVGARRRVRLTGRIDSDVCIVGAGFTGLSAALFLAEAGCNVAVVEAARVGWGASGRNGGQAINGFVGSLDRIRKTLGSAAAEGIRAMAGEGVAIIRQRVAEYGIDCDLRDGSLAAACHGKHMRSLETQHLSHSQGTKRDELELLDRAGMARHVGSESYCGGLLDRSGGHVHPLNLALGEAAAFESLGGAVYENSPATSIECGGRRVRVRTAEGEVQCRKLLLCGNAYLEIDGHDMSRRILPTWSEIVATEPLDDGLAGELLPTNAAVYDMRFIPDYFRLSADRRMLFGCSANYGGLGKRPVGQLPEAHMGKVFPQLRSARIEYRWDGMFAVTSNRFPQLGFIAENMLYGRAYSGQGVNCAHLFGRLLAEAVDGDTSRFDLFAALPQPIIPGGASLRSLVTTGAAWWYRFKDRFGL